MPRKATESFKQSGDSTGFAHVFLAPPQGGWSLGGESKWRTTTQEARLYIVKRKKEMHGVISVGALQAKSAPQAARTTACYSS